MLEDLLGKDCLFNKKVYCGDLQVINEGGKTQEGGGVELCFEN
jgi:hypothetical protein